MNTNTRHSGREVPEEEPNERGRSRRTFLSNTALVGGGALALSVGDVGAVDAAWFDRAATLHDRATVRFTNQETFGDRVYVDSVHVSMGGFVVIHDARLFEGEVVESVIGVSDVLEPGDHTNVPVPLYRGVPGADFEETVLGESQLLVAMAHFDANENEEFDFVESDGVQDGPYLEEDQPVIDAGFAVLKAGVHFQNQYSDGTSVTVDEATLPEGGFVTIHDATLLEGEVFESVIGVSEFLEPERHTGIEVDLFTGVPGAEFEEDRLTETQPLIAMPHLDTDGDEQYGFIETEGEEDGPYLDDGQAVIDVGFVSVEEDGENGNENESG